MSEYQELNEASRLEQQRHAEKLRQYETQKRARSIVVPTAVEDVKAKLRELGQPITLFGEGHADRRERLREVIAKLELDEESAAQVQALLNKTGGASSSSGQGAAAEGVSKTSQREIFYSPALEELITARKEISVLSFQKSRERLQQVKTLLEDEALLAENSQMVQELYEHSKQLVLNLSQFGDDRPLTALRYTSDQAYIISGSWANSLKIWSSATLSLQGSGKGHSERVTSVAHSAHSLTVHGKHILASASADRTCLIWDLEAMLDGMDTEEGGNRKTVLHRLEGHGGIVSCVDFHPHYPALATACHDFSWRLWDLQTGQQLLLQDGQGRDCTALGFHVDGSLVFTGDVGGVLLCWDLRSGQMIQSFSAHGKKITEISCSANGFHVATSSIDNSVKIWDIRKKKQHYTLPAHSHVISGVRYSPSGELLLTSSFDGTVKIWGSRDFRILRSLSGHDGKVMSADFAPDERHLASAGYDRTIKLWAHKDEF